MNTNFRSDIKRPFVSRQEFGLWLAFAEAGSMLQYHEGFLALDIMVTGSRLPPAECRELVDVARYARWASDEGLVHLVQRRLGPNRFGYLAVMRPQRRHREPAATGAPESKS